MPGCLGWEWSFGIQENGDFRIGLVLHRVKHLPFAVEWAVCQYHPCLMETLEVVHVSELYQCPDTQLEIGRLAVATFQFGQENRPFLLGSRFSHNLAACQCVTLAGWYSGRVIWQ